MHLAFPQVSLWSKRPSELKRKTSTLPAETASLPACFSESASS